MVFEISSPSTRDQDLGVKRALDARLEAREYYIYDPQQATEPSFLGYELRAGRMEPLTRLASGGIASPVLGAELRPVGSHLRIIDPATGEPIPVADEVKRDYRAAEECLAREVQARTLAEQARVAAEEQAAREAQARLSAEQRAAQAEAALQAALAELAQRREREGDI